MRTPTRLAVLARTPLGSDPDSDSLPYGLDRLRHHGLALRWSDEPHTPVRPQHVVRRAARRAATADHGLAGAEAAWDSRHVVTHADATLTVFEDVGMAAGRWRAMGREPYASRPLVALTCWLTQDLLDLPMHRRRQIRRSITGMSGLLVYSGNQVPILREVLDLPRLPIQVVPFGVDTGFYHPVDLPRTNDVVAVGRDRSRDYRTLMEAVRGTGWNVTLVCSEYNLVGLEVPPEVTVRLDVSHEEYRELVRRAGLVVTPTHAPAYPGGQSTLLESMAVGACCVMTDSPAIRDYVTDGRDAALVPPHDVRALRDVMGDLLDDQAQREALGAAAHETVAVRFGFDAAWAEISRAIRRIVNANDAR